MSIQQSNAERQNIDTSSSILFQDNYQNCLKDEEIAIIGLGDWGKRAILGTLLGSDEFINFKRFHIIAGDNYIELKSKLALEPRISLYPSDQYEIVLQIPDISSVLICTPDITHYVLTKAALNAGKHVFVEKTFVLEPQHALELVELARLNRCTLAVGYEYMYDKRFLALREAFDSGEMGALAEIDLEILNMSRMDSPVQLKYDTCIVQHHVTHQLSILQLLLGNHFIEELVCNEAEDDYVQMSFRYGGSLIRLTAATEQRQPCNHRVMLVKASRKLVQIDFDGSASNMHVIDVVSHTMIPRSSTEYPNSLAEIHSESSVSRELVDFFVHCKRKQTPISGGENAIHLVRLTQELERAYMSKREYCQNVGMEKIRRYSKELSARLNEIIPSESQCCPTEVKALSGLRNSDIYSDKLVDLTRAVTDYLVRKPFAPAEEIIKALELSYDELRVIYKLIQGSPMSHEILRMGYNYDYFDVVDTFFDRGQFEATFFVGLACPYRCVFCKTKVASLEPEQGGLGPIAQGHSSVERFAIKKNERLSDSVAIATMKDLEQLGKRGKRVVVKISGGLEPMTDPGRVALLIQEARKRDFPVCVYSNGILIKTPELRRTVLDATDLRISLNAVNEEDYQALYVPGGKKNPSIAFAKIVEILRLLVREKQTLSSNTNIGINYVVLQQNVLQMMTMAELCAEIGINYLNFNADYFNDVDDRTSVAIARQIDRIKKKVRSGELKQLNVKFGGSLLHQNIFSAKIEGSIDPKGISKFKVFIDPAGRVTPVHEGTYPVVDSKGMYVESPYVIGRLSEKTSLLSLLNVQKPLQRIELKYLAPLEMYLGLEQMREEQDSLLGIGPQLSPYRRSFALEPLDF